MNGQRQPGMKKPDRAVRSASATAPGSVSPKGAVGLFSSLMVRPAGFEPAAFRSGGERSIRLSYGRL